MLVYAPTNSDSLRFGVSGVSCVGVSFCIHIEQANDPELFTKDMAGWFITIAVSDHMIESCTDFDAD